MTKNYFTLVVFSAAILASCTKQINESTEIQSQNATAAEVARMSSGLSANEAYVTDELLVKFKEGTSKTGISNAIARIGGKVREQIHTNAMKQSSDGEGILLVSVPAGLPVAIEKMKSLPEVVFAEPNYIYKHDATSSDTYYTNGSLWGMYGAGTSPANSYGSNAAAAWAADKTGSQSVYIGIIDEGVMHTHNDLKDNIGTNPYEIPGNNTDDDGNNVVDDIYGWDFVNNDHTIYDGAGDDHGTHVAGTIGAKGGNGIGVVGVCWNVKILNAKFLGANGGTTANAIKAVDYFTALKNKGLNIVATNNSWGGGGYSQGLYDAIERANKAGILFIAAAGNGNMAGIGQNNDKKASYPASYTNANIIAVAAITSGGSLAGYSNYGKTSVDLGAPGSGINSTLPDHRYGSYSGTSMATPHVTGAVALYKSANTNATASQIKSAILSSAVATGALSGKCVTGGRLDANAALPR